MSGASSSPYNWRGGVHGMHKFSFLMVPLQDIAWVSPQPGDLRIISLGLLLQAISLYENLIGT